MTIALIMNSPTRYVPLYKAEAIAPSVVGDVKKKMPDKKEQMNLPVIPTPTPTNGYFLKNPARPKAAKATG